MLGERYLCLLLLVVNFAIPLEGQHSKRHRVEERIVPHHKLRRQSSSNARPSNHSHQLAHHGHKHRAFTQVSQLYKVGDPDAVGERGIRLRIGNLGFQRIATPQWFRPIYTSEEHKDTGKFYGSIIVLTDEYIMMDTRVAEMNIWRNLQPLQRVSVSLMHHRDVEIEDKKLDIRYKGLPQYRTELEVVANLESGFTLFRLWDPEVRFSPRFQINWKVNYNRHRLQRFAYPEDKQRRPDVGCFLFKYTMMRYNNTDFAQNTEVPLDIAYAESERSIAYGTISRPYHVYGGLDDDFNGGSPVFCGINGNLRYFARTQGENYVNLVPIHEIANDIKLVKEFEVYTRLVLMMTPRRDTFPAELGNSYITMKPPSWFKALYRKNATELESGRRSYYAGYMVFIDKDNSLIPDEAVEAASLRPFNTAREWYHHSDSDEDGIPFGDPPPMRQELPDRAVFIRRYKEIGMSLFSNPRGIKGFRNDLYAINPQIDHTTSNCYYLAFRTIEKIPNEPDRRQPVKMPAFVVKHSCDGWFCYVIYEHDPYDDGSHNKRPIMCNDYLAFFVLDVPTRNPSKGRLALRVEYFLAGAFGNTYSFGSKTGRDETGEEPSLKKKMTTTSNIAPPNWMMVLVNNLPETEDEWLGYAGVITLLPHDKYIAADYAMNNAFLPYVTRSKDSQVATLDFNFQEKWLYNSPDPLDTELDLVAYRNNGRKGQRPLYWPEYRRDFGFLIGEIGSSGIHAPLEIFKGDVSTLYDCFVWAFTREQKMDKKSLVFSKIPVQIEFCDIAYCYGYNNPFDARGDLSSGTHAGAPVLCQKESVLMFYNYPIPDNMNRAQFRLIRQEVAKDDESLQPYETDSVPPFWYRLLFTKNLIPPLPSVSTTLPHMIVLSRNYILATENNLDKAEALAYSQPGHNHVWTLFNNTDEPTPSHTYGLFGDLTRDTQDYPRKRVRIKNTGLAVYQRLPQFELGFHGVGMLSEDISLWGEDYRDCWVYIYRSTGIIRAGVFYSFSKFRVQILNCKLGFCQTKPYLNQFDSGAPIVCGGKLSYVYGDQDVMQTNVPTAIQISYIYREMAGLHGNLTRLTEFESLEQRERIKFAIINHEWVSKVLPLYIHRLSPHP